jgi:hypothetical protein
MDWVMRSLWTAAALCALSLALAGASLAAPAPESSAAGWAGGTGNSWSSLGWSGGVHADTRLPWRWTIRVSSRIG